VDNSHLDSRLHSAGTAQSPHRKSDDRTAKKKNQKGVFRRPGNMAIGTRSRQAILLAFSEKDSRGRGIEQNNKNYNH
jgi:hypothetical protein